MKKAALLLALLLLITCAACAALADVILPDNTVRVEAEAFRSDRKLTGLLTVPDGCVSIGDYAFYGAGIYGAVLPSSVTGIGAHAFAGDHLVWVRIEGANVQLGDEALYDVPVVFAPANNSYFHGDGMPYGSYFCPVEDLFSYGGFYYRLFADGTATLVCPVRPSAVPASITLPEMVNGAVLTGMTDHAFLGCQQLREIHVAGSQTAVNTRALHSCPYADVIRPQIHELDLISVPDPIDLYLNGGGDAYDLPLAKVQLLNGAVLERIDTEGLEPLNMIVTKSEPDANGYMEVGLWGPYLPTGDKDSLAGPHTVTITLHTAHDSLSIPFPLVLHSERVSTVHYDWDTSFAGIARAPGETFTIPKPTILGMPMAADRAWDYTLTIDDPSIVCLVSESAAGFTLRAVSDGSTQIEMAFRKHQTNIGESYSWIQSVAAGTPTGELTDGWDLYSFSTRILTVPLFADGHFEGVLSASYNDMSSQNQEAAAQVSCSLDDPSLVQSCTAAVESDTSWSGVTMRFDIGPAVRSGSTTLHVTLRKGTATWSKDIRIITYAGKNRASLDYDIELPAMICTGDYLIPRVTGADADLLTFSFDFVDSYWDSSAGVLVDLPAGVYPLTWSAQLKDLYYPLYNGSRYVDNLASGQPLSADPLATWREIRAVCEVHDRQQPEAPTPRIAAWQSKWPSSVYSADIDKMDPQNPNYPWAEYPVNGYVRVPTTVNGQQVTPVISAHLKDAANLPFPVSLDKYTTMNFYSMDLYTLYDFNYDVPKYDRVSWVSTESLWAFTVQLLVDNRQNIAPGTYICTMQIDVTYPGETLSVDVPVQIVVVKEADSIISRLPAIPTTARVGDVLEELLEIEHISCAAEDLYCFWESPTPSVVISWQGKCVAAGTVHWRIEASYRNGSVYLAEGDITVSP